MKPDYTVSIIIPVLNEEHNIQHIVDSLLALSLPIEQILFIDDGSTDNTLQKLRELSNLHSCIQFLSFSRNFGHQAAIKAGLDFADGDCVITMDGDMQHPPSLLPEMVALWQQGADIVQTKRLAAYQQSFFKKHSSHYYYKLLNACTAIHIEAGTADFRLLDAKVVKICRNLHETTFFWRGIIPWLGFNQQSISYTPSCRLHGTSKYTLRKMFRLAWEGITSFSLLPLRLATALGLLFFLFSVAYGVYVIGCVIAGKAISGWGSLMVVSLGLGSMQMILLGLLGEYVGKAFISSKLRPVYLIKETSQQPTKKP